jgi:hypothetical protein
MTATSAEAQEKSAALSTKSWDEEGRPDAERWWIISAGIKPNHGTRMQGLELVPDDWPTAADPQ